MKLVSSLRYLLSKASMESTIVITLQNAPEEFKLVIVPMYDGGSLGNLINVNASTAEEIVVPVESPLNGSPLISVSVIYQIGPITGCIPGISIPVEGELRLQFVTAGCVTFIVPSEPLTGLNAFFNTITLSELKYLPDSATPDGILVKMGETVTGVPLSDGSFPSMYGSELKETVIAGTSNQVTVTPSYNGSTDAVTLTLSLPQDISTTSSPEFKTVTVDTLNFDTMTHLGSGSSQGVMRIGETGSLDLVAPSSTPSVYTVLRDGTHTFSGRFEISDSITGRVIMGSGAALSIPDTAFDVIAIGRDAYRSNNKAGNHRTIAIGTEALSLQNSDATDIQGHIAIGYQAMRSLLPGTNISSIHASIAIGYMAMYSSTGGRYNVSIGAESMFQSVDGSENVVIGSQTAKKTKPRRCVLIGNSISETASSVEYMDDNVIIGSRACIFGPSVAGCQRNVIIGGGACYNIASASNNTMTGYSTGTLLTTGTQCCLYGSSTNVTSSSAVNRGAFGYGISNPEDNTTIIGNGGTTSVHFGHNNTLTGTGSATLGTAAAPVRGIYLASTNGTPALLDRYEKFTINTTLTGPWSGTKTISITVTVIGTQVFISIPPATYITQNTANSISTPSGVIPLRVRANNDVVQLIRVTNASVMAIGTVAIDFYGRLFLVPSFNSSSIWNHSTGSTAGWDRIEFSYTI
jgi:hypothetical protein